jgi:hypothetical protein
LRAVPALDGGCSIAGGFGSEVNKFTIGVAFLRARLRIGIAD